MEHCDSITFLPSFVEAEQVLQLLPKHPQIIHYISTELRQNVDFVRQAVQINLQAAENLDSAFDTAAQKKIINANPYAICYSTNAKLIEYALELNPNCAPFVAL